MSFHSLRFDRAAPSYDGRSGVQERMAEELLGLLPESAATDGGREGYPPRILEMGCGTGHLTRRLRARFPAAGLYATDAAPRMLEKARSGLEAEGLGSGTAWGLLDAEGRGNGRWPDGFPASFRLAASNALVQWFPDLGRHFALVSARLEPGGCYLASGFAPDNFPELNAILRRPPFCYRNFPGHGEGEVRAAAGTAGLILSAWKAADLEAVYATPLDFLHTLRDLGSARRPESGRPLTRGKLDHLVVTYRERYPAVGGVKATWKPWYALLRKAARRVP